MKMFTMPLLISLITFGVAEVKAQSAWLSTPKSIKQFRNQVESFAPQTSTIEMPSIRDITLTLKGRDISIRVYNSEENQLKPVFIYIYGGCWVAGSLDSNDEISRYLAKETNSLVIAIDYR